MTAEESLNCRYFVTYSGVKLPLKLVNELDEAGLNNRNTFYRGYFDTNDNLILCQKIVYGEVESEHKYTYGTDGSIQHARITEGDEVQEINF